MAESGDWTQLGSWWDRKGENEIDIVAGNELTGTRAIYEVKRQGQKINLNRVKEKLSASQRVTGMWTNNATKIITLSMVDM